jgi:hypothetical protein
MKKVLYSVALLCSLQAVSYAQDMKLPAPSPLSKVTQDFSTSAIEVVYSRPSANGRKVFGDLIPFGATWRTGANNATQITFGEDVIIDGKTLKAGTYSMYSVPNKDSWDIIFNSFIGSWNGVKPATDVLKVTTKNVKNSSFYFNTLNIDINNITTNSCELTIAWENTVVTLPIKVDNDARITEYFENAINNPRIPYQQAANYYLSQNKNLDKAATYAEKALEQYPDAFWLHSLKGKILFKQGKKADAIKAQTKAAELSKGTPYAAEQEALLKSYK